MKSIEVNHNNGTYALGFPEYVDAKALVAGVPQTHVVPAGAQYVAFSSTGDFYVSYGKAAAVPVAEINDGTASELNPTVRILGGKAAYLSLVAPADCIVTLAFFGG